MCIDVPFSQPLLLTHDIDVREPKQIYAAFEETVERLGPNLFVSVANAGVTQVKPLLECTPEYVHAVFI